MIKAILVSILEILFVGILGCGVESLVKFSSPLKCGNQNVFINYLNIKNVPFIPIWALGALVLILLYGFFDWTGIISTTSVWFYLLATVILIILECVEIKMWTFIAPNFSQKVYDKAHKDGVNYWKGYKKDESVLTWCNGRNSLRASVLFFICVIIFYKFIHPLFTQLY